MSSAGVRASARRAVVCLALALTLLVPTVGIAAARTTSANETACKKTSGEPVLVSTISSETPPAGGPNYKNTVLAAAKGVNCAGGIHGRPLKMITCDGNPFIDPNSGQNCARDAINQGVVASAAMSAPDAAIATALMNAGIPMVGVPLNLPGLTNPLSFVETSGALGLAAGPAAAVWDRGARKIRLVTFESPLTGAIDSFMNQALAPRGGKTLPPVQFPTDPVADDSALIQSVISGGTDAVYLALDEGTNIKVIPELRAAGYKGIIAATAAITTPKVMKAIGAAEAKKLVLAAGLYPTTATQHKGIAQYNADMDKYAAPGTQRVEASINAWLAVYIIADALNKAPTVDKQALVNVLNTYKVTQDAAPVVDWGGAGSVGGIPRIFTALTGVQQYRNGNYYMDGDFFDPLSAPATKGTTKK